MGQPKHATNWTAEADKARRLCAAIVVNGVLGCVPIIFSWWWLASAAILAITSAALLVCCGPRSPGHGAGCMFKVSSILAGVAAVLHTIGFIVAAIALRAAATTAHEGCQGRCHTLGYVNVGGSVASLLGNAFVAVGFVVVPILIVTVLLFALEIAFAVQCWRAANTTLPVLANKSANGQPIPQPQRGWAAGSKAVPGAATRSVSSIAQTSELACP